MRLVKDFARISRRPRRRRCALGLERLEDRVALSTFVVLNLNDSGDGSLRQAIAQANGTPGPNEIDFATGLSGTITLTGGQLTIANNDLTIVGPGADQLSVSGDNTSRVFQVNSVGAAFSGLTITGGSAPSSDNSGGGLYNNGGTVTIAGSAISGNSAGAGGGLYNYNATVTITGSTISDNAAAYGGGLYNNSYDHTSLVTITASTISGNSAATSGGGIDNNNGGLGTNNGGIISITASTISGNSTSLGGGLHSYGGMVTVSTSTISHNSAFLDGGGLYCVGKPGSLVTIIGSSIRNNSAADGGGLSNNGGTMTIADSTIRDNSATGAGVAGGGIDNYTGSTLTILRSTISGNSAGAYGGGIDNIDGATATIIDSTIRNNHGDGTQALLGGGIYSYNATVIIANSSLSDNSAAYGGGLYNNSYQHTSTATIADSTVSGNSALQGGGGLDNNNGATLTITSSTISGNSGSNGGGVHNFDSTVLVASSTISDNTATNGGGLDNYGGTLTITDCTLSGDTAEDSGGGLWTAVFAPDVTTLSNTTITANRADANGLGGHGGGLFVDPGSTAPPVLDNTLIAGNVSGAGGISRDDVSGTLDSGSAYDLIGDGTGSSGLSNGVNGNQIGSANSPIDPLLAPLGYYGGPTQTLPLLPGSPALKTGDPAQLGVPDQRGVLRTGGVNIGAYQASASAFLLTAPPEVMAGVPFDLIATAVDPFGQVAVGYAGTVTFSTSDPDPRVVLPADYTFTADDAGVHTFSDTRLGETTLFTHGYQSITATDTADGSILGQATVEVKCARQRQPWSEGVTRGVLAEPEQDRAAAVLWSRPVDQADVLPPPLCTHFLIPLKNS
jgi:hypothetical protein